MRVLNFDYILISAIRSSVCDKILAKSALFLNAIVYEFLVTSIVAAVDYFFTSLEVGLAIRFRDSAK